MTDRGVLIPADLIEKVLTNYDERRRLGFPFHAGETEACDELRALLSVPASKAPTSVGSRWSRSNKLAGFVGTSRSAEPDLRSLIKQIRQAAINSRSPFGFEILALIARASPNGSIDHPSVS